MSVIHAKRAAALFAASTILENVKAAGGRDLTDAEDAQVSALHAEISGYDELIAKASGQKSPLQEIADLAGPQGNNGDGKKYLDLSGTGRAAMAAKAAAAMRPAGSKALATSGDVIEPLGLTNASPVALGKVPSTLLSVLAVNSHSTAAYGYLRQASRNNQAAPVADGATKPTSVYGLSREERKLEVAAHLSEPISDYWLADAPSVKTFVDNELLYGLFRAVEAQVINGNGTSPNMRSLLNQSGIQVIPAQLIGGTAATDYLETTRRGINNLESLGYTPGAVVLNSAAWLIVEGLKDADGRYLLDAGIGDRAARKLFGVQVITSPAMPTTTGLALDLNAVALDTDKIGIRNVWGTVGTDFSQNLIRGRSEGRWNISVYQPEAVAKLTFG